MECLPEELLVHIFSYLDTKDLSNLKTGCKPFQNVIYSNSKRMLKKKAISLVVGAKLDDCGKRTVLITCGYPLEHEMLLTDTQIIAKEPSYLEGTESKEKILQRRPYKQKYEKHLAYLDSMSRTISDGSRRLFGPENPLQSTSVENEFEQILLFFLRRFNLDFFTLDEEERNLTCEEMAIILAVIKATGPITRGIQLATDILEDQYLDIIKELKCNYLSFGGYSEHSKENQNSEYSVNKRILQIPCEELFIYESVVSVPTVLLLLKEWQSGSREINKYTYYHDQKGLDWFALVEEDFKIIKVPEEIIWTCNATIYLNTFTVAREIDEMELHFYYYGTYLELQCYPKYVPPLPAVKREPTNWDDEIESLDFGLFD